MSSTDNNPYGDASDHQGFHQAIEAVRATFDGSGCLSSRQKAVVLSVAEDGQSCQVYCPNTMHASLPNPIKVLHYKNWAAAKAKSPEAKFAEEYYKYYVRTNFTDGASVVRIQKPPGSGIPASTKQEKPFVEGSLVEVGYEMQFGYPAGGAVLGPVTGEDDKPIVLDTLEQIGAFISGGGVSGMPPYVPPKNVKVKPTQRPNKIPKGTKNLRSAVGYKRGKAYQIWVVTVGWAPTEYRTAAAFLKMQKAAKKAGVKIYINSGFRTYKEQWRLRQCYLLKICNKSRQASAPGWSRHQSGFALDLNTKGMSRWKDPEDKVFKWLTQNAKKFGFKRTVSIEPWHWVWFPRR